MPSEKEVQYILRPVSGTGRLLLNKKDVPKGTAKTQATLLFEEIAFLLDRSQYQSVLMCVNHYHYSLKQLRVCKNRPPKDHTPKTHPREWWDFAGKTILSRIHDRNRRWSWDYLKERRDDREKYIDLYHKVRQGTILREDEEFKGLEYKLPLRDLRFYRALAQRRVRKEKETERREKDEKDEDSGDEGAPKEKETEATSASGASGWLSSWWYGANTASNQTNAQSSTSSGAAEGADGGNSEVPWSKEDINKLYDTIGYEEGAGDTLSEMGLSEEEAGSILDLSVGIQLQRGSLTLLSPDASSSSLRGKELLTIALHGLGANAEKWLDQRVKASLSLRGFSIRDGSTPGTLHPYLAQVNPDDDEVDIGDEVFFRGLYEGGGSSGVSSSSSLPYPGSSPSKDTSEGQLSSPEENQEEVDRPDRRVELRMRNVDIVWNGQAISALEAFFRPPEMAVESLQALIDAAGDTLEGLREQTRLGLQYALEEHKQTAVHIDLAAPTLIIPESCTEPDCLVAVVDCGRVGVRSVQLVRKKERERLVKGMSAGEGQVPGDDDALGQLASLVYDRYQVDLSRVQVLLGRGVSQCLSASRTGETDVRHLLDPVGISCAIDVSILPKTRHIPAIKVTGRLPALSLHMSDQKWKGMMRLVDVILKAFGDHDERGEGGEDVEGGLHEAPGGLESSHGKGPQDKRRMSKEVDFSIWGKRNLLDAPDHDVEDEDGHLSLFSDGEDSRASLEDTDNSGEEEEEEDNDQFYDAPEAKASSISIRAVSGKGKRESVLSGTDKRRSQGHRVGPGSRVKVSSRVRLLEQQTLSVHLIVGRLGITLSSAIGVGPLGSILEERRLAELFLEDCQAQMLIRPMDMRVSLRLHRWSMRESQDGKEILSSLQGTSNEQEDTEDEGKHGQQDKSGKKRRRHSSMSGIGLSLIHPFPEEEDMPLRDRDGKRPLSFESAEATPDQDGSLLTIRYERMDVTSPLFRPGISAEQRVHVGVGVVVIRVSHRSILPLFDFILHTFTPDPVQKKGPDGEDAQRKRIQDEPGATSSSSQAQGSSGESKEEYQRSSSPSSSNPKKLGEGSIGIKARLERLRLDFEGETADEVFASAIVESASFNLSLPGGDDEGMRMETTLGRLGLERGGDQEIIGGISEWEEEEGGVKKEAVRVVYATSLSLLKEGEGDGRGYSALAKVRTGSLHLRVIETNVDAWLKFSSRFRRMEAFLVRAREAAAEGAAQMMALPQHSRSESGEEGDVMLEDDDSVKKPNETGVSSVAQPRASQDSNELSATKKGKEGQDGLRMDVIVQSPVVEIPLQDGETTLVARLGQLSLENELVEGGRGDKVSLRVRQTHLASQVKVRTVGHENQRMSKVDERRILEGVDILVDLYRLVGEDQAVALNSPAPVPGMRIQGWMSAVEANMTAKQYRMLLETVGLAGRLATQMGNDGTEEVAGMQEQMIGDQSTPVPPNLDKAPKEEPKEETGSSVSGLSSGLDVVFTLERVKLELLLTETAMASTPSSSSLAILSLSHPTVAKYRTGEDTEGKKTFDASLVLHRLELHDARNEISTDKQLQGGSRVTAFPEIIPEGDHDSPQCLVDVHGEPSGRVVAQVTVDSPKIILNLGFLLALKEFFTPLDIAAGSPSIEPSSSSSQGEEGKVMQERATREGEEDSEAMVFHFRVNVVDAQAIVLAHPEDPATEAIVLSTRQVLLSQQGILAATIEGLGVSVCRMDHQEETTLHFVDPLDLSITVDGRRESGSNQDRMSIGVEVRQVTLRLSLRDMLLITEIASEAAMVLGKGGTDQARDKGEDVTKTIILDQEAKSSSQARENRVGGRVVKAEVMPHEELTVRLDGLEWVLIGDLTDLPLVDVRLGPAAIRIRDWSSEVSVETLGALRLWASYFNGRNSHWEPLVEPWEVGARVGRDREGVTRVNVRSRQRLEVSITHALLEHIVHASLAISSATEEQEGEGTMAAMTKGLAPRGSYAPYRLRNHTGHPMHVWSEGGDNVESVITRLDVGEEIPWRFEDWRKLRDRVTVGETSNSQVSSRRNLLGMQLEGGGDADVLWESIKEIPVDRENVGVYRLRPDVRGVGHRVVVEVALREGVKIITFRSSLVLRNRTLIPLEVLMESDHGKRATSPVARIDPGEEWAVPIAAAYLDALRIRPEGRW